MAPTQELPVRIATVGAAFSANKGAASMVQAVVDTLPARLGKCEIDVLTTYPVEDRAQEPGDPVRIVSLQPRQLVFPVLPIALLAWVVRRLGGSDKGIARRHPATRSLAEADVVLDLAGISFAHGRGFPILVYNVLMTGVPLLLGATVIKCSQAIGPFRGGLNRRAARFILPRLEAVLTRGARTHEHALSLGLTNAHRADDLAFLMQLPEEAVREAKELLDRVNRPFIIVAPSSVVRRYCSEHDLDYVDMLSTFVRRCRETHDVDVVILPHSARPGMPESRMNDLPVCRDLHAAVGEDAGVHLVDRNLGPTQLRALIAEASSLVTSRFHAMISALATTTPVLVVGWSHKYEEVLDEFEQSQHALSYDEFTAEELEARFERLWNDRDDVVEAISRALPPARERAERNLEVVVAAIRDA